MAPMDPTTDHDPADETSTLRRGKTVRLLVPVGVAGVAAATIGLVPALASSGGSPHPDLPKTSAEKLLTKLAASDVQTVSGTVKITTDFGLPGLLGGSASHARGGSPFGPGPDASKAASEIAKSASSADPSFKLTELVAGSHTLRIAADGPDRQRVSIVEDAAEYSIIHSGDEVWAYDSGSNQAYHAKAPAGHGKHGKAGDERGRLPEGVPTTPSDFAKQALKTVGPTTSVTVGSTTRVAGRDAYRLVIKPKQSGSTVGSIVIAVDADNGAPLKFTLTPRGSGKAAVDVGFTDVGFAKPATKNFRFTPPKGTKVTEAKDRPREDHGLPGGPLNGLGNRLEGFNAVGKGWTTVAEFKLPGGGLDGSVFKEDGKDVPGGLDPQSLLKSLGDKVHGDFGSGTVINSRLFNVLITDSGKVYAGAVTKDVLIAAADKS
ncbi:LolA family protein [Wenjunlia tyrosinilytica]|uniref:Outer membrane lipoprotein carrier protein LolA n=1 Tax=Wenjunlia tyrosinilytica TaxID=1544741 RepID=A0A917ZXQ6_9ACTN|nr:DUF2092 domain-containing protein [Wenjunlia tyrosinilytica]GGO99956.1 hypothetical protein GCM10012280_67590 [Wenjunlia tyrosinilytica]